VKRYGPLLIPLGLGLVLAAVWQAGLWPNPVIKLRADVGTLLLFLGLAGSIAWGWSLASQTLAHRHYDQALARLTDEQADSHRRFIRRLDHELKNPLTAIRAALVNLTEQSDSVALSGVRSQVDRLARLSADLRKLADLETQPIEREAVDLGQLLTELLELAQQRPENATCHLKLILPHVPWPLPPVAGDRDLLFLALHNMLDNALKFCRTDDTIEIRAFEDGPSIAVEVADTGPGIHPEDLPHLGEELYRGKTTRGTEGSGLGLALVQTIVERHGGSMRIRSRLGQGTVVALRFPVAR
jgi:two-component system OmpR family sensor kinase